MNYILLILCLYVLPTILNILYVKYLNKDEISPLQTFFIMLPIMNVCIVVYFLCDCFGRFMENNWLTNWINKGKINT